MKKFRRMISACILSAAALLASPHLAPAAEPAKPIARVSMEFNLDAARAAYPNFVETVTQFIASAQKQESDPATEKGRQQAEKYLDDLITKVNHLSYELTWEKDDLTISYAIAPSLMPGQREFPKPLFPDSALFIAHLVYPHSGDHWLPQMSTLVSDNDLPVPASAATPEQVDAEKKAIDDMITLLTAADAESVAVENHDGKIAVTLVTQYDHDIDVPARLRADIDSLQSIIKAAGQSTPMATFEPLTPADGSTGYRILLPGPDQTNSIFLTQKNHVATFSFSQAPGAAPAVIEFSNEKITTLGSARINPAAILSFIQSINPDAITATDPDHQLAPLFANKSVTMSAYNDGDTMRISAHIPTDLIRAIVLLSNRTPTTQQPIQQQ